MSFGRVIRARNSYFTHCVIHVRRVLRDVSVVRRLVSGVPRKGCRRGVGPVVHIPRKGCCTTIRNSHKRFNICLRDHKSGFPCHVGFHTANLPLMSTVRAVYHGTGVTSLVTVNKAISCMMPSVSQWWYTSSSVCGLRGTLFVELEVGGLGGCGFTC